MSKFYVFNGQLRNIMSGEDDGIGVVVKTKQLTFDGDEVEMNVSSKPLAQWADSVILGRKVSLRFYIDDHPIDDPVKALEDYIVRTMGGQVNARFHGVYSDLTGHLWTEERFKVGGHDVLKILYENMNKYIHMEVEVF